MQNVVPHRETSEIQVIDRAVLLLRVMQAGGRAMGLAEIAVQSGLSKSTARRILASLEVNQLCERVEAGSYQLGLGLLELGTAVRDRIDLRERSRSHLERLAEETHLTIYLCIRRGDVAVCIDRLEGRYADRLALGLGGSLPLHAGGAPRALLAHLADEDVEAYLARPDDAFERATERTLASRDAIRADVGAVRGRGFSVAEEDVAEGTCAVGAPIFDDTGDVVAALSISGLASHVTDERLPELTSLAVDAGFAISRALGFTGHTAADGPRMESTKT